MNTNFNLARYLMTGILLGLLVLPPPSVQAQFGGIVHDPITLSKMLLEWEKELERWKQQMDRYTQMIDKATQQVTSLKGILQTVDEELAKQKSLIRFTANVGQIIRGTYALKQQLQATLFYRIKMIKSIDDRLRNGIFNPDADLTDFENYLKYTIGRSSQDTVAKLDRLARLDAELEGWYRRLQEVEMEIATTNQELTDMNAALKAESKSANPADVQHLNAMINEDTLRMQALENERAILIEKITARLAKYGLKLSDMENFAFQIVATNEAWESLTATHDQMTQIFDEIATGDSNP